jgi:hypothetical protein
LIGIFKSGFFPESKLSPTLWEGIPSHF